MPLAKARAPIPKESLLSSLILNLKLITLTLVTIGITICYLLTMLILRRRISIAAKTSIVAKIATIVIDKVSSTAGI